MPVRYEFEKELNQLHRDLVKMGAIIEKQMDDMIHAFLNLDVTMAKQVIERDDEIDDLEQKIEQACILLIARQQPIASDLRDIASILKMITDLERIADHCEDISHYTIKLSKETFVKPIDEIPYMADKVKDMVSLVIDSCVRKDVALAKEVEEMDDVIDDLFEQVVDKLQQMMKAEPDKVKQCTDFMFVAKYLERMGDHAGNIAGWITYNVTGKHYEY